MAFRLNNTYGAAKLSWDQVRLMRAEYLEGATQRSLSDKYHVSTITVGRIVRNESWKDEEYNPSPSPGEAAASAARLMQMLSGEIPEAPVDLGVQRKLDELSEERQAEVLEKLEQTAQKDPNIQADKALDSLLDPEGAKKFLE